MINPPPVPPESERKVVRRFRGGWATATLSRAGGAFYVTLSLNIPSPTAPDITLCIKPTVKAEAIAGARFLHWLVEQTGQYAAAEAAGVITSFSKS